MAANDVGLAKGAAIVVKLLVVRLLARPSESVAKPTGAQIFKMESTKITKNLTDTVIIKISSGIVRTVPL